ncbi:MAG: cyclic nucleotide-binding domain-containing protein, partial [SAR324 cluster bacterium]|nr:cyclic nucleotide-binding domain-containing protein [SAR324 cluster bacterium]
MELVQDPSRVEALRGELIQNLKDFGFDGQAIVALVLNSEAVVYAPKEPVLRQGKREEFIFFMMEGNIEVALSQGGEERVIGSREPFTLLGEIAFFNKTAASATVVVTEKGPATLFRLSYEHFEKIVSDFADVKAVLMRIGDLRVINQYNGFAPFANYMELIGWQRDRFALNRAISGDLEFAVETVLFPHLQPGRRVLEVGDGPAIVLEMINGAKPDMLPGLFLQAN